MAKILTSSRGGFINGNVSSVIRLGSANQFVIQPGSRLRKSTDGLDEITRIWVGPKEGAVSFAESQTADPEFHTLYPTTYDISLMEGGHVTVTVTFAGLVGGSPSIPFNHITANSLSTATATFFYDFGDASLSVSAQYLAPSTTHTWMTAIRPGDAPAFTEIETSSNPWDFVQAWRFDANLVSGTVSDIIDYIKNNVDPIEQVVAYDWEEVVPFKFWRCTAKVARVLFQPVVINNS